MRSLILLIATQYLLPLMNLFAVYLLIRGHNKPGGGFVGGLIAATGFILYLISHNAELARRVMRVNPIFLIAGGLATSFFAGLMGLFAGEPFLAGLWFPFKVPILEHAGTPILFDFGIYLVVLGVVMLIVLSLAEEN